MNKKASLSFFAFVLAAILIGGLFILNNHKITTPQTKEEIKADINTAIKSTELSSYGWKTQQDKNSAVFALKGYINSKIKEAEALNN